MAVKWKQSSACGRQQGFTLVELLVVASVVLVLLTLLAPAFNTLKTGSDITAAAQTMTSAIETARIYAQANNTYTWLGFYEEDPAAASPTNAAPPYPAKGRVILAIVASLDGTPIFTNGDPAATLPAASIRQVGKLIKIDNIHLTDVAAPAYPSTSESLDGRPDWPYTYGAGVNADHYNRISSDSSDKTQFNFVAQNYTFYKTIRFNPRGEANINSTYSLKNLAEIGVRPTHGGTVDTTAANALAIQFTGITSAVKVYRK